MSLLKVNEVTDLAGVIPDGVGRIVQIVRATDATERSTSSQSYVDVTGMSVSITPTSASSNIIVVANFLGEAEGTSGGLPFADYQITDSSNVALSGAERMILGTNISGSGILFGATTIIGYDSPATTSATVYKLRFKVDAVNRIAIVNGAGGSNTSEIYAIEVAA